MIRCFPAGGAPGRKAGGALPGDRWTAPGDSTTLPRMSKAAKATGPTFEEALGKLEAIVEAMEGGDLPLEQLLARYEEGARLVTFCQGRLAAAEVRLRELEPQAVAKTAGAAEDEADVEDDEAEPDPDADEGGAAAGGGRAP